LYRALLLLATGAIGLAAAGPRPAHAGTRPEAAQAEPALRALEVCIHRLDPLLDVGYSRVAARCPELAPALTASPWAPWLPHDWDRPGNELSAAGLQELRTQLTRPMPVARTPPPRTARVRTALAGLATAESPRAGWWTRFKQWLRELFTPRQRGADDNWLRRLFGDTGLPQAVLDLIAWIAIGAIVALAAAIVANELRVAGVLRRRASHRAPGASGLAAARVLTLRQVDEAGPLQQPRLLLELIVARLRAQERLPPPRALTVHELARALRLPRPDDRARFAALTAVCERIRFGGHALPPSMLDSALARGRELLGALDG
jgi:hypothetical protein